MARGMTKQIAHGGRGPHRVSGNWPCQRFSAETAEDRGLHRWQPTLSLGCFTCQGCGVVGVCPACYARYQRSVPRLPVRMRCSAHAHRSDRRHVGSEGRGGQDGRVAYEVMGAVGTGAVLVTSTDARTGAASACFVHQPPPVSTVSAAAGRASVSEIVAAVRWARLTLEADALAVEYEADLTTPSSQRDFLRRRVRWALDAAERFQHGLTPIARRLAREALWRRDHTGAARLLPPYAPPGLPENEGESGEPYGFRAASSVAWPSVFEGRTLVYRRDWERCQCPSCRLRRHIG